MYDKGDLITFSTFDLLLLETLRGHTITMVVSIEDNGGDDDDNLLISVYKTGGHLADIAP